MNLARLILARLMWWLQCRRHKTSGRMVDWMPMHCERCGWTGPLRWMVHGYQDDGAGDVEGVNECPRCGSDDVADDEYVRSRTPYRVRLRRLIQWPSSLLPLDPPTNGKPLRVGVTVGGKPVVPQLWWSGMVECRICSHRHVAVAPAERTYDTECPNCHNMACDPVEDSE